MSYFPTDIPYMGEEELKANGIEVSRPEEPNKLGLRNCPFCGKEAEVEMLTPEARYLCDGRTVGFSVMYKIGCYDCGINFRASSQFTPKDDGSIETVRDGYKAAADAWNRRANVTTESNA